MKLLEAFFPTSHKRSDDRTQGELAHYMAIVRGKAKREEVSLITEDWWRLEGTVRHYLARAFLSPRVHKSTWHEGAIHDLLYGLWELGDGDSKAWRERLRNHCEHIAECPSCGFLRDPAQNDGTRLPVDHYLPRAEWPELSIVATNLVPICDTCNSRLKKANAPRDGECRLYLHPYFDTFIGDLGLRVEVGLGQPPSLNYALECHMADDDQRTVAQSHFELLHLAERYLLRFTRETLGELRARLRVLMRRGQLAGVAEVEREVTLLRDTAEEATGKCHWKAAGLEAIATSPTYLQWLHEDSRTNPVA